MVTCWLGYNVIEIRPSFFECIVIVLYGMSRKSACRALGAATREQSWVLGRGYNLEKTVLRLTNIDTCNLLLAVQFMELLLCR